MQAENVANCSTVNNFQPVYTEVMEITKVFALNLNRLRGNMSADALGKKVGVTAKHIYDMEKERRNPSLDLIVKLAKELNVSVGDLLEESGVQPAVKRLPVSQTLAMMASIPDEIYELSWKLNDPKNEVWEGIASALEDETKYGDKRAGHQE